MCLDVTTLFLKSYPKKKYGTIAKHRYPLKRTEQEGFLSGLKMFAEISQQDVVPLMDVEQVDIPTECYNPLPLGGRGGRVARSGLGSRDPGSGSKTFFGNTEPGSGSDDSKERLGVKPGGYKEMSSLLADQ
jgi:hypothetical protein